MTIYANCDMTCKGNTNPNPQSTNTNLYYMIQKRFSISLSLVLKDFPKTIVGTLSCHIYLLPQTLTIRLMPWTLRMKTTLYSQQIRSTRLSLIINGKVSDGAQGDYYASYHGA